MVLRALRAFSLCVISTVISVITVLNFSLAACLAFVLGLPLTLSPPDSNKKALGQYFLYISLAFGWLAAPNETKDAIWAWQILGVWLAPFICMVYTPLLLQLSLTSVYSIF